jgi:hypothetical protein
MNSLPDRRRMKGVGRVAFIAHLAEITAELGGRLVDQGGPGALSVQLSLPTAALTQHAPDPHSSDRPPYVRRYE